MSDGQKTFWLSAAFVVVIAIGGVTLWKVQTGPRNDALAALNAKVEQTNAKLAEVQKATATKALAEGLTQLQDNIKGTNEALAKIQRTIAAGNVRERLDTLEKNMQTIAASLTSLQKAQATADLGGKVTALESDIKALSGALSDIPKAAALKSVADQIAAIKQAMPQQSLAGQIDPLNDKIKTLNDTLADIQKSTSLDGVKTQLASLNSKLESTSKAVAGESQSKEAVIFYLHMPNEKNLPQKVASIQPLDIQFEKIGSTDDNGQAGVIIPKLKALVQGRTGCTISVAGYADTVGGDQANLKISQKRARNIAQKIKAAFSGSDVTVNEAAWGERRLKAWTPDGTANENNRRVDIAVNCKS
jgi:outer membrane protein OmpA-like peptidoglycan-associated protein